MTITLTWLGHGSFKLETASDKIIYLDPWIEKNPVCPIKLSDVTRADIVCVTHGHTDHIGDSIKIVNKTGAVFVSTPELYLFAKKNGIPDEERLCSLNIGGSSIIRGIEVIMTNAAHTSDIMPNETEEVAGSGSCGYVLVTEDDARVYFAGDTGVFLDMKLIADLYAPKLAIMPIGGKYTMGEREAAYAAYLIRPEIFVPMHFGTYSDQQADLNKLRDLMMSMAPFTNLIVLKPGESLDYTP